MNSAMIEISHLAKSFGENKVLVDINLKIEKGETVVIIGRSGCGKSVLLKHIIGLMKPDEGKIIIDGEDLTGLSEKGLNKVRRKFGMLFQGAALFDSLSVGENVGFFLEQHSDLTKGKIGRIVKEKLRLVGLENVESLKPAELSGGMKKRVGLARAIAVDPEIILYDEPTTGVDPIMADAVNELIIDLHNRLKVTSIAVTHDIASAYKIGDRIAMFYEGRIIEEGTPEEIRKSKNEIVQQFINGRSSGPISLR